MAVIIVIISWILLITLVSVISKKFNILNLKSNKGLSKTKRLLCAGSGFVLINLVIWFTVADISSLYSENRKKMKIRVPSVKVEKLTEDVTDFRVLTHFISVNELNGDVLDIKEKILTPADPRLEIDEEIKGYEVKAEIEIDGIYHRYGISGSSYIRLKSFNSSGSRSGGLSRSGSFSEDIKITPYYSSYRGTNLSIFSMHNSRNNGIEFFLMTSRLAEGDDLKTVDFSEINHYLKHEDNKIHHGMEKDTPFESLMTSSAPAFLILLLGIVFITISLKRRAVTFPVLALAAALLTVGLKKYEYSAHENIALNKELQNITRLKAAANCSVSHFFLKSGEKIFKEIREEQN